MISLLEILIEFFSFVLERQKKRKIRDYVVTNEQKGEGEGEKSSKYVWKVYHSLRQVIFLRSLSIDLILLMMLCIVGNLVRK